MRHHGILVNVKKPTKWWRVIFYGLASHPMAVTTRLVAQVCFHVFRIVTQCCGWISDQEVFQEHFEVHPSSGALTDESLCGVCKIQLPNDNWEPQTVARVSISTAYNCSPSQGCLIQRQLRNSSYGRYRLQSVGDSSPYWIVHCT